MRKLIKTLVFLSLCLVFASLAFVLTIDPTRLAPIIQAQLASQGIQANFKGKIGWRFYPQIGLSVSQLELISLNNEHSSASQTPLASIGEINFDVELKPLLSREIRIIGAQLKEANISLLTNTHGDSNWHYRPAPSPIEKTREGDRATKLSLQALSMENITMRYVDLREGTDFRISSPQLHARAPSIDGNAFPLSLDFVFENLSDPRTQPESITVDTTLTASIDGEKLAISIDKLHSRITITNQERQFLSTLAGSASFAMIENTPHITSNLVIDTFDVDALLDTSTASNDDELPPAPLPINALQTLNLNARLHIHSAKGFGLSASDIKLAVQSDNGRFDLTTLDADIFHGTFRSTGTFDTNPPTPVLLLHGDANDIDIAELLKQFAENDNLAGQTQTTFSLHSKGRSTLALTENIVVEISTQSNNLVLQPLNIEQQVCKLLSLIEKDGAASKHLKTIQWPAYSELKPVEINARYAHNTLSMDSLDARLSGLSASASGAFDTVSGKFDFPIQLSLTSLINTENSCFQVKESWLKRTLPLRCKGSLDNIGAQTCLPDTDLIADILKQNIKVKRDAKLAEEKARIKATLDAEKKRAEEKAKDKLESKLNELLEKL